MLEGERVKRRIYYWFTTPPLAEFNIFSPEAFITLCYPRINSSCSHRLIKLSRLGVHKIYSLGPSRLPGLELRVLGKGFSSTVVAGSLVNGEIIAIKSRRTDSKRIDLTPEGEVLDIASKAGVAPKPIYWDKDTIVMEAIIGPRLEDILKLNLEWPIIEALRAARTLDTLNIAHLEINRPWRNILYRGLYNKAKALIIDYESSSSGCTNVSNLIGGLLPKLKLTISQELREALKYYKRECSSKAYTEIEKIISYSFSFYSL
ncbi:MAG: hypothetical protein QXR22_00320 [Acidilobaceae archaeon]